MKRGTSSRPSVESFGGGVLDSLDSSARVGNRPPPATGAPAHDDWDSVLRYLPDRHAPRFAELTIGYRLPGPSMELASRVLRLAAPGLRPPTSVRATGDEPIVASTSPDRFEVDLAASGRRPGHDRGQVVSRR